ncbi:hypothetical protein GP486_007807, partial [Trichoglossum hirsutum]
FRKENTVPNISFASSLALNLDGRGRPGPPSSSPALAMLEPDCGRRGFAAAPEEEAGTASHCLL